MRQGCCEDPLAPHTFLTRSSRFAFSFLTASSPVLVPQTFFSCSSWVPIVFPSFLAGSSFSLHVPHTFFSRSFVPYGFLTRSSDVLLDPLVSHAFLTTFLLRSSCVPLACFLTGSSRNPFVPQEFLIRPARTSHSSHCPFVSCVFLSFCRYSLTILLIRLL